MRAKRMITNTASHVLLAVLSLIWVLPIFYVVLTSFRKEGGTYKSYIWPKAFTLDNYKNLITGHSNIDFTRWFLNTFIIAILSTILAAFFVLCVSYCMSRLRFKMRKPFMNVALILGMFPGFMSMIAVYYILKGLGLLETGLLKQLALVLVYSGGAGLGFYMAKGFFDTIPKTIDEAAYIDGASKWDTFVRITIPLSKPIDLLHGSLGGLHFRKGHHGQRHEVLYHCHWSLEHAGAGVHRLLLYPVLCRVRADIHSYIHSVPAVSEMLCGRRGGSCQGLRESCHAVWAWAGGGIVPTAVWSQAAVEAPGLGAARKAFFLTVLI